MARIAVVVTARASWAKLQTLCEALQARPDVELQIIACASALLERYGKVVDVIRAQGFTVTEEVWSTYEGANLLTSAKETGSLVTGLSDTVRRLSPSMVVVCADRHEVLGAAQAVVYQHVPLVHLQGGERTGSIDDRVRDSITALADVHFTCTERAKYRVVGLTGAYDRVWNVGCPSLDLAKRALDEPPVTDSELGGTQAKGEFVLPQEPFLVVLQHPDTRTADRARFEMQETLSACWFARLPTICFWPGQDAGMEGMAKVIRQAPHVRTVRNLPPQRFLKLLTQASVLIGNSSAGIREASYLGVPVVNVGDRQHGRERAANVVDVPHDAMTIWDAIKVQLACGRYPSSSLYGTGHSGQQIAEILTHVSVGAHPSPVRL